MILSMHFLFCSFAFEKASGAAPCTATRLPRDFESRHLLLTLRAHVAVALPSHNVFTVF